MPGITAENDSIRPTVRFLSSVCNGTSTLTVYCVQVLCYGKFVHQANLVTKDKDPNAAPVTACPTTFYTPSLSYSTINLYMRVF